MLANIFIFLILIALMAGAGWLTWRAIRARRLWVKIAGGLVAGLLTLVFAAIVFFAGKGLAFMYIPPVPAPDIPVAGAPEQVARGNYLVSVACISCHSADQNREFPLTGGADLAADTPIPIGKLVATNLTPAGVLADRSNGELFRAIRHGFGKGARATVMSFMPFRQLSDEDTQAVIAFLRSQEPVQTETKGGDRMNILGAILLYGAGLQPFPETTQGAIPMPSQGPTAEYGKYVAT